MGAHDLYENHIFTSELDNEYQVNSAAGSVQVKQQKKKNTQQ